MQEPFTCNLAGVSYANTDGSSRQAHISSLYVGAQLTLRDAATDQYPEAIAVFDSADHQLGFLPAYVSTQLRADGMVFSSLCCLVVSCGRPSPGAPVGVTISIGRTRARALSLFTPQQRRLADPTYKPTYTPSHFSSPPPRVDHTPKRTSPGYVLPIICLLVAIPLIAFIVYTIHVFPPLW